MQKWLNAVKVANSVPHQYIRFQFLYFIFSSSNYLKKVSNQSSYILFFAFNSRTNEIDEKLGRDGKNVLRKISVDQKCKFWIIVPDQKWLFLK